MYKEDGKNTFNAFLIMDILFMIFNIMDIFNISLMIFH